MEGLTRFILPIVGILAAVFLFFRLELFSRKFVAGKSAFLIACWGALLASGWSLLTLHSDYSLWFVPGAYPIFDFVLNALAAVCIILFLVGLALQADQRREESEEISIRENRLGILESLQRIARQPYPMLELMDRSLGEITGRFGECAGAVFLLNRDHQRFVLVASRGLSREHIASLEQYPHRGSLLSQTLELGEPSLVSKFDFPKSPGSEAGKDYRSVIVFPLMAGTDRIGNFVLFSPERDYFDRSDIRSLFPVAQWLAETTRSNRLLREIARARQQADVRQEQLANTLRVHIQAGKSQLQPDAINAFCRSLVGTVSSQSVHLCGLQQGLLVFHGGSQDIAEISESLKSALHEALNRTRPLVINQEAPTEDGRNVIVHSTLVIPIEASASPSALLLRRDDAVFKVSEIELRLLESLGLQAAGLLRHETQAARDLSRRRGFDAILQLLRGDRAPKTSSGAPEWFCDIMQNALPDGTLIKTIARSESGELSEICDPDDASGPIPVTSALVEDGPLTAVFEGEVVFVVGRGQVVSWLEHQHETTRAWFERAFGESGQPIMLACLPLRIKQGVVAATLIGLYDLNEKQRAEWKRLLTLAVEITSIRLDLNSAAQVATEEAATVEAPPEVIPVTLTNRVNNDLTAVLGAAELLAKDSSLSSEGKDRLRQIIENTESAAARLRESTSLDSDPELAQAFASGPTLGGTISEILEKNRVSGRLCMFGNRAREVAVDIEADAAACPVTDSVRELFQAALDRFSALAKDSDMFTVAVYKRDEYAYLDVSRHRVNFPPVEPVARFAHYQTTEQALQSRPTDAFLNLASQLPVMYAFDADSDAPAFLSFKFPLKDIATDSTTETATLKILAVDDQPVILELIEAMGQSLGYDVQTAKSGQMGLELARNTHFDVILTDLAMPGMSGLDMARQVQAIQPGVPVVVITGWETKVDDGRLKASGVVEILRKPFRIEQLTETIRKAARIRHSF